MTEREQPDLSPDELRFRADVDLEAERQAHRQRQLKDRRADQRRDTMTHRVIKRTAGAVKKTVNAALPHGSKRRTVAATTAVVGGFAVAGGVDRNSAQHDAQARAAAIERTNGTVPAAETTPVSATGQTGGVEAAGTVTSSVELTSPTPEDQTVVMAPESSSDTTGPQTGGVAPKATPDTGGVDASSSSN